MNLVIDTSVLIAVLVSEPERARIIKKTESFDLIAPASVHWEIGNALAAMLKRKRIKLDQVKAVLLAYEKIPIRFRDADMELAMDIASEHDLYAYDAYIIACARESRCALISLDKNLLYAARKARVSILEVL
jgi:predicted nucleic acid-binding protein